MASFLQRLEGLDGLMRIVVSDTSNSCLIIIRGEGEARVLLDFSTSPFMVSQGAATGGATVQVAVEAPVLHRILLGEMKPGLAVGRRQLLLRGSPSDLARFFPLFDVAPGLYREHLDDLAAGRTARKRGLFERSTLAVLKAIAYALGYLAAMLHRSLLRKRSLLGPIQWASRRLAAPAVCPRAERARGKWREAPKGADVPSAEDLGHRAVTARHYSMFELVESASAGIDRAMTRSGSKGKEP